MPSLGQQTPRFRQPPRSLLLHAYQHLLLACLTGLVLVTTPFPAAAPLLVVATQMWRLRLMRRRSPVVAQPMLQAIVHARGYLQTANAVLKSLGVALFLGLACQAVLSPEDGLLACRLLMALALTHGGFVTWLSYKVLCRETEVW